MLNIGLKMILVIGLLVAKEAVSLVKIGILKNVLNVNQITLRKITIVNLQILIEYPSLVSQRENAMGWININMMKRKK